MRVRRQVFPKAMVASRKKFTSLPALGLLTVLLGFSLFLTLRLGWLSTAITSNPNHRFSTSHAAHQDLQAHSSMGGLLPRRDLVDGCHSRSQHHLYRKPSTLKPSDYLISKLRRYEKMYERCAGEARNFQKVLESSSRPKEAGGCQFVVWVSYSGLGNKLVTLAATFLYALLTNRVLLVDRGKDMAELFCEPFPGASWLLPSNFPQDWLLTLGEDHPSRFAHMFDAKRCVPDARHLNSTSNVVYIHLTHTYNLQDRRFFCEGEQKFLSKVPWLFLKSNNYFVPSFYFMPTFRAELERMFPDSETIFHHLGRYLLHPSNVVWDRAVRFYESYLAEAERLVGLQLRTFDGSSKALQLYSDQVFECLFKNRILPNVTYSEQEVGLSSGEESRRSTTSVLITSLHEIYYEKVRDLYLKFPTEDRTRVKVHLPSHEGVQKTDTAEHDKKALMEIFLLSFSDKLVTSPMSTFGYVAQGLAGLKPLVLRRLEDSASEPVCSTVLSMEPCFHAPPLYDCDCQGGRDPGKVLDRVKHCRDVRWGIQVVN